MHKGIACRICEEVRIDRGGNANCRRTYSFRNREAKAVSIDRTIAIALHKSANYGSVRFDDARNLKVLVVPGAYHQEIRVFLSRFDLEPGQQATLHLNYTWPEFLPKGIVSAYTQTISLMHGFDFTYELEIGSDDPGLLGDPAFTIQPPDSRRPRPYARKLLEGGHFLGPFSVAPKETLSLNVSVHTGGVPELKLLKALSQGVHDKAPFKDLIVVFIQHLLSDFEALLSAFTRAGLQRDNTFIIGIPYSVKDYVFARLGAVFDNVVSPPSYPFLPHVRTVLNNVYDRSAQTGLKYIIVEDGGYFATLFRDDPEGTRWSKRCLGIVEQTRNGLWVTEHWIKNAPIYPNQPNVAVVDVASTRLKAEGESPLIGRAVILNVKTLLRAYEEQDLPGQKALLVGCGSVGSEVAKELLKEGCEVTVVDQRPLGDVKSFPAGAKYRPLEELSDALRSKDLIIGATGRGVDVPEIGTRPPFDKESHFLEMKDHAVLVNASSKLCEFSWDAIENVTLQRMTRRGFGHERRLHNGKVIRFAADGFPVNFYASESAPAAKMQPVLGMLFWGAYRITEASLAPGIAAFSAEDQEYISRLFHEQTEDRQ